MKIWIVGPQGCGKRDVYRMLRDDKFTVGQLFTNIPDGEITYNRYLYKTYPSDVINEIFENGQNAFVVEDRYNGVFTGLDFGEYDDKEVFVLTPQQFLAVNPTQYFKDSLIVWLDGGERWRKNNIIYDSSTEPGDTTYNHIEVENYEKIHYRAMHKAMMTLASENKNVIYFCEEDPKRVKTIVKLYAQNPKLRADIIKGFTPVMK